MEDGYLWISENISWKTKNYFWRSLVLGSRNRQLSSKRGGGGISFTYAFLGICEATFRCRDLSFLWNLISIYFRDIKWFDLDLKNLEPAPGCPAYLFFFFLPPILELEVLEQAPDCQNLKKNHICEIYTDMRFHTK